MTCINFSIRLWTEHLALVTFFDKQWDYIFYSAYIGWFYLVGLSIVSQIHYLQVIAAKDAYKMNECYICFNLVISICFFSLISKLCALMTNYGPLPWTPSNTTCGGSNQAFEISDLYWQHLYLYFLLFTNYQNRYNLSSNADSAYCV